MDNRKPKSTINFEKIIFNRKLKPIQKLMLMILLVREKNSKQDEVLLNREISDMMSISIPTFIKHRGILENSQYFTSNSQGSGEAKLREKLIYSINRKKLVALKFITST